MDKAATPDYVATVIFQTGSRNSCCSGSPPVYAPMIAAPADTQTLRQALRDLSETLL
ncbi:protein of unknown function [Burkholderia multivorans]